jgi:hypothetical protein
MTTSLPLPPEDFEVQQVTDVEKEGHQAISGVLDEMAGLPVDEMLPSLEEVFFRWVKREDWAIVWEGVNAGAQMGILRGLAGVLPGRMLEMAVVRW